MLKLLSRFEESIEGGRVDSDELFRVNSTSAIKGLVSVLFIYSQRVSWVISELMGVLSLRILRVLSRLVAVAGLEILLVGVKGGLLAMTVP